MSTKVRHVDAVFGGKPVRFEITDEPSTMHVLEHVVRMSPFEAFRRFADGTWTLKDVRSVLGLSYGGRADLKAIVDGGAGLPRDLHPVRAALASGPPGPYAMLAAQVLEAYLFGIDPKLAKFDERKAA